MRNASQEFTGDASGLQAKLDALNMTKATLKVDVDKAKTDLREAEKALSRAGDAKTRLQLEAAQYNFNL
jgi:cellobiose-specific phosphotransferase system component IIA